MARTFFHDVSVELFIGPEVSIEVIATIERAPASPAGTARRFSCPPFVPATYWQPADGGEVEILKVVELFIPAKKGDAKNSPTERRTLECPAWLEDWIIANVSDATLAESLDADARDVED